MFFCDSCAEKNQWPKGMARSSGPCEACGHITLCYDVPSNLLVPVLSSTARDLYTIHAEQNPLLPCAFCGERGAVCMTYILRKPLVHEENSHAGLIIEHFAQCLRCLAQGPHYGDRLLAHHAWQRRVNPWEFTAVTQKKGE